MSDRYEDENGPPGPSVTFLVTIYDGLRRASMAGKPVTINPDGSVVYDGMAHLGAFTDQGYNAVLGSAMRDVER